MRQLQVWKIKERYLITYIQYVTPTPVAVMSGERAVHLLAVVWGINEVVAHKGDPSAARQS